MGITKMECRSCGLVKPLKDFYKNSWNPSGYITRCKSCKNNGILIPRSKYKKYGPDVKKPNKDAWLDLRGVQQSDYTETYQFLTSIGYRLDDEKSIHQQFCEKYGLNVSNRKRRLPKGRI